MFITYEVIDGVMWRLKECASEAGAKRSVTVARKKLAARVAKGYKTRVERIDYMDGDSWMNRKVPMKKVRNLMTGEMIEIPADTPMSCDPSTETYWSM